MQKEGETKPPSHEIVANEDIEVFILAGGKGSRLRNQESLIVPSTSKHLFTIITPRGEITMLDNIILGLLENGFEKLTLMISHLPDEYGDDIQSYTKRHYPDESLTFSIEDKKLGTAGAVELALSNTKIETAIITPVDILFPLCLLPEAIQKHEDTDSDLTWIVTTDPGEDAQNSGRILIDSLSGIISIVLEGRDVDPSDYCTDRLKPATSTGIIIARRDFYLSLYKNFCIEVCPKEPVDLYRHFIPWIVTKGYQVATFDIKTPCPDLGTPDRLRKFGRG